MISLLSNSFAIPTEQIGTGETILFWVLAPLVVLAALSLLFIRKAVHAAVLMAAAMIGLAIFYAAQDAPFLFAAQIVVYTGAVMMLFLFVLMLVGVDTADSVKETLQGQRVFGLLGGVGLAFFLIATVTGIDISFNQATLLKLAGWNMPETQGIQLGAGDTNPQAVAREVFGPYVFTFLVIGTLLVIAAVGAIVLTHTERIGPKRTQREWSIERVRSRQVTPLPSPGVFARSNAVDTPALLPDGTASELSVSRVLRIRDQNESPYPFVRQTETFTDELEGRTPEQAADDLEPPPLPRAGQVTNADRDSADEVEGAQS